MISPQARVLRTAKHGLHRWVGALLLLSGFWLLPVAQAQSISLNVTNALSLLPGQTEFEAGQITQTGAISVFVATDYPAGCTISVQGGTAPALKNGDLLFRSSTSGTASGFSTFAPLSNSPQILWSTTSAHPAGVTVWLDVRLRNLRTYPGGANGFGSSANYTNVITITALPN